MVTGWRDPREFHADIALQIILPAIIETLSPSTQLIMEWQPDINPVLVKSQSS